MNKNTYKQTLRLASDFDFDRFMEWLYRNPDFLELSALEIEVNFLIHRVAEISYKKGAKDLWTLYHLIDLK